MTGVNLAAAMEPTPAKSRCCPRPSWRSAKPRKSISTARMAGHDGPRAYGQARSTPTWVSSGTGRRTASQSCQNGNTSSRACPTWACSTACLPLPRSWKRFLAPEARHRRLSPWKRTATLRWPLATPRVTDAPGRAEVARAGRRLTGARKILKEVEVAKRFQNFKELLQSLM